MATATPSAPLAALVNGEPVFLADYERRVSLEEQAWRQLGLDLDSEEGRSEFELARHELLQKLIDQRLIQQEGESLGVVLSAEEVNARMQADIEAGGGQEAFSGWLEVTGQTVQDYELMLREALVFQRVMDQVTAGVPAAAEQLHIRRIVVGTEADAAEVLTLLQQGKDFGQMAQERSLDSATKDAQGDMGWLPLSLVEPELRDAVAALAPGQTSAVLRLGDRHVVLQVLEREPDRALAPDSYATLKLAVFHEWLEAKRAAAVIQRFVGP